MILIYRLTATIAGSTIITSTLMMMSKGWPLLQQQNTTTMGVAAITKT
jgi:hypothetical protein